MIVRVRKCTDDTYQKGLVTRVHPRAAEIFDFGSISPGPRELIIYPKIIIRSDKVKVGKRTKLVYKMLKYLWIQVRVCFDDPKKLLSGLLLHRREAKRLKQSQPSFSESCKIPLFLHETSFYNMN